MKRSEMKDLIKQTILNSAPQASYIEEDKLSEEILNAISKAGMLPPTTKDKDPYYKYNTSVAGVDPLRWCKWEKE